MTGPTGMYLNLADSGERNSRKTLPCLFWFARAYNNPLFAEAEHAELAKRSASPQHVVWYVPAPRKKLSAKDLDRYFRGPVEVAVFRSDWDDPEALFVGVKAGYNQVNHGHLDLGNFELDALGVRWARDLGSDNYNLPGYWDRKKGGKRWSYYRLNSRSHSIPLLGGEDQNALAKSRVIKFETKKSSAFVLVDLTSAYKFLAKHLGLSLDKVTKPDGSIDESFVVIEKQEDMYAFNADHPRPKHTISPDAKKLPWD